MKPCRRPATPCSGEVQTPGHSPLCYGNLDTFVRDVVAAALKYPPAYPSALRVCCCHILHEILSGQPSSCPVLSTLTQFSHLLEQANPLVAVPWAGGGQQ